MYQRAVARQPMLIGILSITRLWWSDLTLTYFNFPILLIFFRFNVTSKYSAVFKSVSTVMLNTHEIAFLTESMFFSQCCFHFLEKSLLYLCYVRIKRQLTHSFSQIFKLGEYLRINPLFGNRRRCSSIVFPVNNSQDRN